MLVLVSMTATAAVGAADEHNLLKAGGFHFLRHFSNPLLFFFFFVYNGCLNGGSYHLLFRGIKSHLHICAGSTRPPFPRGLSQFSSSNMRMAQSNRNGDEC